MLCLLYRQHRPITLFYITTCLATCFHLILVCLNLENGEVSAPALHVLCTFEELVDYRSLPGYEGSVDYCSWSRTSGMLCGLDAS